MFLSMNWIGDFVDLSGLDLKALIHRFTLSTAEVEDIIEYGRDTHGVIAAEIASIENHPNSKKLHLLKINTGKELIDCVCGAPNVRVGMHVAFAQAGGAVCGHAIGEATVAGYPSFGMCCSEAELGISADHSGLMELDESIPLGTDIKAVFDLEDTVFEVDNKSLTNRPDLWGHYGIAREFATLAGRELRPLPRLDTAQYASLPDVAISIEDPDLCYRYTGIKVENIKKNQSPVNMRIRLFYCGSRAINLLADLTNYVMMELGQPMHAFDLRRVDKIEVKRFAEPFTFRTLDGQDRQITPETLMICSGGTPVAVAGIMGGLDSEIEDDTDSLLLESANFNGVSVRKSSTKLGLRTDASMRYEKILDPEMTIAATERFLDLLCGIDPDVRVISSLTDVYVHRYETITLTIDKAYVDRYTGIDISSDAIEKTLLALGFTVARDGDSFTVTVPSFRATKDVTIKADLIEEITRIYGYDNFEIGTTRSPLRPVRAERTRSDEARTKDLLVSRFALHEVHSYIWSDRAKYREIGIEVEENVRLLNAQTPDHAVLRRSMIPTLLSFINENKGFSDEYGIFEIGRVVLGKNEDGTCRERKTLGLAFYSRASEEETLFFRARDAVSCVVTDILHVAPLYTFAETAHAWEHPANTYTVSVGDVKVGSLSVVHPAVAKEIDRKAAIVFAELDMDTFAEIGTAPLAYREISKYPAIDIDLCFTAPVASLSFEALVEEAKRAAGESLANVTVADTYGDSSITLRFTFSSNERTLTKAELQPTTDAIIEAYKPLGLAFKLA
ncbi:MAG: phenylalanine--tRNA ligase subunit beta [Clostridia bacterium]|nr:phenylalanine--tRNA ligase subunit beta [Clostridia bacterium]